MELYFSVRVFTSTGTLVAWQFRVTGQSRLSILSEVNSTHGRLQYNTVLLLLLPQRSFFPYSVSPSPSFLLSFLFSSLLPSSSPSSSLFCLYWLSFPFLLLFTFSHPLSFQFSLTVRSRLGYLHLFFLLSSPSLRGLKGFKVGVSFVYLIQTYIFPPVDTYRVQPSARFSSSLPYRIPTFSEHSTRPPCHADVLLFGWNPKWWLESYCHQVFRYLQEVRYPVIARRDLNSPFNYTQVLVFERRLQSESSSSCSINELLVL